MNLRLSEIALWTRGTLRGNDRVVRGVATDTREALQDALFVALKGDNFDGHDFAAKAHAAGAVALLVAKPAAVDLPQVVVPDTLLALGDLASHVRAQHRARVVGITGSNGKTTVKTLIASILALHGKTHVNAGNFNNEIGLPLSLLAMPDDTEYAVFEMGAGKPGDIDYLAAIARPEIGLVNNIGPAHLERMGSLEGVVETKGALYAALPAHGVAVINADEPFADLFAGMNRAERTIRFGFGEEPNAIDVDVGVKIHTLGASSHFALCTRVGDVDVALPLAGRHNVANAMAAASIALALDVPLTTIKRGLETVAVVKGRLVRHAMRGGWTLIDDSYNANPASTAAAIATLKIEPAEAWLVLGDMRELGLQARALHAQTGALAKRSGIARLYTVGDMSDAATVAFGEGARHFADREALAHALAAEVHAGINVLVKGSRGSAMERIVEILLAGNVDAPDKNGNGGARHAA
ncbi:MAG: UDP-N-acetylmuramoyl-tripeptide--D-alanyl-D-alanine ligase [Proteobacteria bacterium]|nr:UDP-N-acetylmuramoyl-tripeptide--D-alanyl-D-alanine ligase [Pseudomonadota bacterium]